MRTHYVCSSLTSLLAHHLTLITTFKAKISPAGQDSMDLDCTPEAANPWCKCCLSNRITYWPMYTASSLSPTSAHASQPYSPVPPVRNGNSPLSTPPPDLQANLIGDLAWPFPASSTHANWSAPLARPIFSFSSPISEDSDLLLSQSSTRTVGSNTMALIPYEFRICTICPHSEVEGEVIRPNVSVSWNCWIIRPEQHYAGPPW